MYIYPSSPPFFSPNISIFPRYSIDRGVSFEEAHDRYTAARIEGRKAYFLLNRNSGFGHPSDSSYRPVALAVARKIGNSCSWFRLFKPTMGVTKSDTHRDKLTTSWLVKKPEKKSFLGKTIEEMWKEQHTNP